MAISAPIDATKTPAWVALQKHHDELVEKGISLKDQMTSHSRPSLSVEMIRAESEGRFAILLRSVAERPAPASCSMEMFVYAVI